MDFLRGFAMLLVIFGHIARPWHMYFVITGPFKIPLFFAINGYVSGNQDNLILFIKKQLKNIVVPWIFLSLVWIKIIRSIIAGNYSNIIVHINKLISGKLFWFIPCILVSNLIQYFIRRYFKRTVTCSVLMVCFGLAGILMVKSKAGNYAMLNIAFLSQLYVLFGYLYRKAEDQIHKANLKAGGVILCLIYIFLIIVSIEMYPGKSIDVHLGKFYNYFICGMMTAISLFVLFFYADKRKSFPRWIVFVGKNTLIFYLLHYYVRRYLSGLFGYVNRIAPADALGFAFEFAVVCFILTVLAIFFNRYFPVLVGRRRENQR